MIRRPLTSVGLKQDDIDEMKAALQRKFKNAGEVLGSPNAWENAEVTEGQCSRCAHTRAYFMQIQTRSADGPAKIFYRCANSECAHLWET